MAIQGTWREPKPEEHDPILKQRARLRDFYDKEQEGYETAVRTVVGERYTPPEKREHSLLGEAARGVARGVVGLAQVVPETAEFALSDVLGIKPVEKVTRPVIEKLEKVQRGPALRPSESVAGVSVMDEPTQLKNLNWWAANVPEAAVSIAGFFLPGAAAGRVAKILKYGKMIKEAQALGDTARIAQITGRISKIAHRSAIASGMALEGAGARQRLRQFETEHPEKSVDWGNRLMTIMGTGIVAGSLEALSLTRIFGGKPGRSLINKVIEGIAVEGSTEGAQEVVANAFQKAGYDPDQSLVQGVVDSIVIGGALGAFGGGAEAKYERRPKEEGKPRTIVEKMLGMAPTRITTPEVTPEVARPEIPTPMSSPAGEITELGKPEPKERPTRLPTTMAEWMGARAKIPRVPSIVSEETKATAPGPVSGEAISEVLPETEPEKIAEKAKPKTIIEQTEVLNTQPIVKKTEKRSRDLDNTIEILIDTAGKGTLEDKKRAFDFLTQQRPDIGRYYFQVQTKGKDVLPIEVVTEDILEELGGFDLSPEDQNRLLDNPNIFPELYEAGVPEAGIPTEHPVEEALPTEIPPEGMMPQAVVPETAVTPGEVVAPEVPPEMVMPPAGPETLPEGIETVPAVEEVLAGKRPVKEEVEMPRELKPEEIAKPEVKKPVEKPVEEKKPIPEAGVKPEVKKEPWEMTKAEYIKEHSKVWPREKYPDVETKLENLHRISIQEALDRKEKIPEAVLKDYPELVKKPEVKPEEKPPTALPTNILIRNLTEKQANDYIKTKAPGAVVQPDDLNKDMFMVVGGKKPTKPITQPVEPLEKRLEGEPEEYVKRIYKRQAEMTEKYRSLFGTRIEAPKGTIWELSNVNDLGHPYFRKVVNNKPQKREYTVAMYNRNWLDTQLKEKPTPEIKEPTEAEARKTNTDLQKTLTSELKTFGTKVKGLFGVLKSEAEVKPKPSPIPGVRMGVKTIAMGIRTDLINTSRVNLRGKKVKTAEDVAIAGQVYRDPRFETLRIIYTKGDRIKNHEGLTSRMPGYAKFGTPKDMWGIQDRMKRIGADGYYLLHNHPSGRVVESQDDANLTGKFNREIPGFKGHIIIDSGVYSILNITGNKVSAETHPIPGLPADWKDPLLSPALEHELLGTKIKNADDVAQIGQNLKANKDFVTLLYLTSDLNVRAIQEMPVKLFTNTEQATNYIRGRIRQFGTPSVVAYAGEATAKIKMDTMNTLLRDGVVLDVVGPSGITLPVGPKGVKERRPGEVYMGIPVEETKTYRVAEKLEGFTLPKWMTGKHVPANITEKYAGSINLERRDSTEAMKEYYKEMAEIKGKVVRSWDEAKDKAGQFMDLDRLHKLWDKQKGVLTDSQIVAARTLSENAAYMATEASKKFPSAHQMTDLQLANYIQIWERAAVAHNIAYSAASESARALAIHRMEIGPEKQYTKNIDAIFEALGGKEITRDIAEKLQGLDPNNILQVNKMIQGFQKANTEQKFFELWINSLLSAPTTHVVNFTSSSLTTGSKPIETGIAAAIDFTRSKLTGKPQERFMGEVGAEVYGMMEGLTDGLRVAGQILRTGLRPEMATKLEVRTLKAIKGKKGELVRLPSRFLMAADEFWKAILYRGTLRQLAFRQAMKEGLTGKARAGRITEIITHPELFPEIHEGAEAEKIYRVFQKPLGPWGQPLSQLRQRCLPVRYIMPFLRTPINIAKYGLERTPLNFLRIGYKALAKEKDMNFKALDEIARATFGSLIGAGIFLIAADDREYITSGGPKDKEEREALYRTGWQPYSIVLRDEQGKKKYYYYGRLEPLGMVLGLSADFSEVFHNVDELTQADIASKIATTIGKNLLNKTFMRGVSDLFNAIADPPRYGERWIESLGGTIIPTGVATFARSIDNEMRRVSGVKQALKGRVPWVREELMYRRNLWGEPIEKIGGPLEKMVTPFYRSEEKLSQVDREIVRLAKAGEMGYPGMPQEFVTVKGERFDLDEKQYDGLVTDAGRAAKKRLDRIVGSGYWKHMSDEQKADTITKIIQRERKRVRDRLKMQLSGRRARGIIGLALTPTTTKKKETKRRPYAVLGF